MQIADTSVIPRLLVAAGRRHPRPPRRQLGPAASLRQAVLLGPGPAPGLPWNLLSSGTLLLLAIPALAWLAIDARPALPAQKSPLMSAARPHHLHANAPGFPPVTYIRRRDLGLA